jgi:hypothetical protein
VKVSHPHSNHCASRRTHDTRHTAATVLLFFGVPDVVVDSITGWQPGGAAWMRARYMQ